MRGRYIQIIVASLVLLAAPLVFTGCSTTRPANGQSAGHQRLVALVKLAAYVGTTEGLRQHPEWRTGFELAKTELARIEAAETIDFTTVLSIVNRLPVKELRSDRATMFITAGTIILSENIQNIDLSRVDELRAYVKAIREGIELGL